MERTLVLVKPLGVKRGLIGKVIDRFERQGLRIVGLKMLQMDEPLARRHYEAHLDKPFFPGLLSYITSGPIVAMVVKGENAIKLARDLIGATDPAKALPGTIRADYAIDAQRNLVHGSDSPEAAEREISLFFDEDEIFSYEKVVDPKVDG
ncbi:MAG: nucleoside-diphosphate kinase [Anaerolineae bacterium]